MDSRTVLTQAPVTVLFKHRSSSSNVIINDTEHITYRMADTNKKLQPAKIVPNLFDVITRAHVPLLKKSVRMIS